MWTSIDEPHQTENLETVYITVQKLGSEYLARATKRNNDLKSIVEKQLLV